MKTVKDVVVAVVLLLLTMQFSMAQKNKILSTKVVGQGHPMILIHGMSCSADVWDEVVKYYQNRYEIHLVTLAGFGNSNSVEVPHFLEAVKDELIEYTRKNKLKNPILMGHSMGGFLSYWASAEAPDLFKKVVAVDGMPYFPALQGLTVETAKPMVEMMRNNMGNMDAGSFESFQRQIVASMIGKEDKRDRVVQMGMESNQQMTGQAYSEMYLTDLREKVSTIKTPVLVLTSWYGYKNYGVTKDMTQKNVEANVANIVNAKVRVADTALHFIFYDEPEWFFAEVDNFLNEKI